MKIKKLFIPASILFLITLQAYYFPSINLAPFPLIGFFVTLIVVGHRIISLKEIKEIFPFVVVIFISILIGVINLYVEPIAEYYFPTLLGWLLMPIAYIYFKRYVHKYSSLLPEIIVTVLFFHLVFFYLQFFAFHILNLKLDFIELITGETQRIGAAKLKSFSSSNIRAAGLYTEPGSYSVYIFILLSFLLKLKKKFGLICILGLISMFLSFSLTGILMAVAILLYYLSSINFSKTQLFNILIFGASLLIFFYYTADIFLGPIYNRITTIEDDGSVSARFNSGIIHFIRNGFLYSGIGIGIKMIKIKATSAILGALFNLGLINFLIYIIICIKKIYKSANNNFKAPFLLLVVLFSNIAINQFIFIFFLAFMTSNMSFSVYLKSN